MSVPKQQWDDTTALLTAPGKLYELRETVVRGIFMKVFDNAPPSLGHLLRAMGAVHSDKTFLVYEGETWRFSQVAAAVEAVARALVTKYGVRKGHRVAIAMRNYPEWIITWAAALMCGAIAVSINSWWTRDELEYALGDCDPLVVVCDPTRCELMLPWCQAHHVRVLLARPLDTLPGVDLWDNVINEFAAGPPVPLGDLHPDDDATILYTSGTTGRPKGAVSTHRAVISGLMCFGLRNQLLAELNQKPGAPPDDTETVFILIVPLFHVTGLIPVMLNCYVSGLKLVMMFKWNAEDALKLIAKERVTNFFGVPTQSWDLLHSPSFSATDTSSLRVVGGGGAPAPPALVEKLARGVTQGAPSLGYGMTETNSFGPGIVAGAYVSRPTSCGRVVLPMRIEIRDTANVSRRLQPNELGEICFFGPSLFRGYWNRPDATAECLVDGWLRSGDLGRIDEDGFVYIEDRIKDMILRGGENVFGAEVEAVVYERTEVHEAAVFGVPHERLGEEVALVVKYHPGHTVAPADLRAFLATRMAAFKVPAIIAVAADPLPRNAAGKFLKRKLRDDILSGARPAWRATPAKL